MPRGVTTLSANGWSTATTPPHLSINRLELDTVLHLCGAAPIEERAPVVAIGSNASPGQLAFKYRNSRRAEAIPITRAVVTNLSVAHSAHVRQPGYIPWVPVWSKTSSPVHLHVLWLDEQQVQRMDETEPNYTRTKVDPSPSPATLESGITLRWHEIYRGRWGVLCSAPGHPVDATSQADLLAPLCGLDWFQALVPESRLGIDQAVRALAADSERRDRFRDELAARSLVVNDGFP